MCQTFFTLEITSPIWRNSKHYSLALVGVKYAFVILGVVTCTTIILFKIDFYVQMQLNGLQYLIAESRGTDFEMLSDQRVA